MNAIPSSRPPLRPVEPLRRRTSRPRLHSRQHPHQAIATEVSTKLIVNLVLAIAAGTALVKLLPYNLSQREHLRELQTEVATVEERVERLRNDFDRNFDPKQTRSIMQEQSSRIDASQRQVVWQRSPLSE